MKLQYRETKWFAGEVPEEPIWHEIPATPDSSDWEIIDEQKQEYQEALKLAISQFKEIAPQDQEIIQQFYCQSDNIKWTPDPSKLYDSGDLVFELQRIRVPSKSLDLVAESKQYWTLKEVKTVNSIRTEMPEKLKEAYNVPSLRQLCWRIDREIWAKVEVHEATQSWGREQTGLLILDFLKEIQTEEQKTIQQLQSRIAELEEQRERLIAELMNAEDKLKSKESN